MLPKEEQKRLNLIFWNGFQNHLGKTKSSNGKRINWLNYPSDVKSIFIRLEADSKGVRLCFDIQPKDDSVRAIIWEQMTELQVVLEDITIEKPIWEENLYLPSRKVISRIYWEDKTLNFYKPDDHPKIYDYLKERLTKFDLFYQEYKEILIALVN
jgi:hypothetical protein